MKEKENILMNEGVLKWAVAITLGLLLVILSWETASQLVIDALPSVSSKQNTSAIAVILQEVRVFFADHATRSLTAQVFFLSMLGMISAWKNGTFDLTKAPDFLRKYLIPELCVYYVLRLVAEAADYDVIRQGALVLIQGKIVALSLAKFGEMGLPMPDFLTRKSNLIGGENGR